MGCVAGGGGKIIGAWDGGVDWVFGGEAKIGG